MISFLGKRAVIHFEIQFQTLVCLSGDQIGNQISYTQCVTYTL